MAKNRFDDMQQTQRLLQEEFSSFKSLGFGLQEDVAPSNLLYKKISNQAVRAYFVAKIAQWFTKEDNTIDNKSAKSRLFNAQLPFIFETIISIQYLHNQILDAKAGVVGQLKIAENLLAANLMKDQLYRYIQEELPTFAKKRVEQYTRKCFEYVDLGQILELKANRYSHFTAQLPALESLLPTAVFKDIDLSSIAPFIQKLKRELPVFMHEHLDVYFHRMYLSSAVFFVHASQLVADLLQIPAEERKPIRQFSVTYGMMRQLVNDNADWLPSSFQLSTNDKKTSDGFSDLRNQTLTLPLFFFLAEHNQGLIKEVLDGKQNWSATLEEGIFDQILNAQSLYKSIQNTRILGELAMAFLPQEVEAAQMLAHSCEIVHWNKFLVPCLKNEAYKTYRRTTYYKKTKSLIKRLRNERLEPEVCTEQSVFSFKKMFSLSNSLPKAVQNLQALLLAELNS